MSGAQTSSFYPVNQLLVDNAQQIQNQYAPQRNELFIQKTQQEIGGNEIEYAARAAQGLLSLGDEAAMAAAYPGAVASARQQGFLKNAPSVFPGKARMQQIAAMGVSAEKQYERQGVATDWAAFNEGRTPSAPGAVAAPGAAAAVPIPPRGTGGPGATAAVPTEWLPHFYEASRETGIPVELLIAQARQESSFNPKARGAAGEIGLFQIKPSTAQSPGFGLAGVDPATLDDPRQNILFGARYLRGRMGQGDPNSPADQAQALAAYNGGGDPNYVANVNRYRPGLSPTDPARAVTAYTPAAPGTGGGVVARNPGAVNVAGPGAPTAPTVPAPVTIEPETGVPVVASPAAAPAVPAQPGVTTPAQAAPPAQQPPAATVAPPPPRQQNGLTVEQNQDVAQLRRITPRTQAQMIQLQQQIVEREAAYRQHNETVDRQYQTDVRTAQEKAETAASRRRGDEIRDQQEARAQQKAADEQRTAGRPYQGTAIEAQDDNILLGGDDGSAKYAGAYSRKAAPINRPDGSSVTPVMAAYDKPTYKGGKGQAADGGTPDYGAPKVTPPTIMNVEQAKSAAYVDRMAQANEVMNSLDSVAMDWVQRTKGKMGDFVGYNISSPEYQRVKIAQENFITAKLRDESGASIGTPEFERDRVTFFPQPGDDAATIELKRKFRQTTIDGMQRQAGPAYKPPAASGSTGATAPARTPPPPSGFRVIQ